MTTPPALNLTEAVEAATRAMYDLYPKSDIRTMRHDATAAITAALPALAEAFAAHVDELPNPYNLTALYRNTYGMAVEDAASLVRSLGGQA